jgi:uncharacterized protein with PIN domain
MKATFTFVGDLNDFLPHLYKNHAFSLDFASHQSFKHLIESLGVPHTDIGRLLANGQETSSNHRMRESDQITVYPADEPLAGEPRFVLDNHLGQLATYLRMLGFDSLYRNDFQDEQLANISTQDGRVLLTRDRRLLMRKEIRLGYCIHQIDPRRQAVEVLRRYKLEPLTKIYYDEFRICPNCSQIYWKGSHYGHMLEMIESMAAQA